MMEAQAMNYRVEGEGFPVFLIHGIGASLETWDGLVPLLSGACQCIRYDLRGHGRTSRDPGGDYSLDALVDDLEQLRKHLGLDRAGFVGHSLGAMIAARYAHRYPQHGTLIGLVSTAAGREADDSERLESLIARLKSEGVESQLSNMVNRWFTDEFAAEHGHVIEARKQRVRDTDPDVFISVFETYARTEMIHWLEDVNAPALIVTGELDGGCPPRLNRKIRATLPQSELFILHGLKHNIPIQAPERLNDILQWFIEGKKHLAL